MPPLKYSPEEMELLSDEEREGLLEDVDNEDTDLEDDDTTGGTETAPIVEDDTSGLGADPLKPAPTVEDVVDPAKKEVISAALDHTGDASDVPTTPAFPKFEAPADSTEKLKTIEEQIDALAVKFDDGELSAAEYRAQTKPLEAEQRKIERVLERAELSRDVSVETWTGSTVPQFFEAHPQYKEGGAMYAALDNQVRIIQAESANPFDPSILARAHKAVQTEMRKALGLPDEEKDTQKQTPKPKRDLPPSLVGVPAADITDTQDNSEFAYLDRLQDKGGTAFEDALAKLTDEQRDRYLFAN